MARNGDRGSDAFDIVSFNDYSTGDRYDMMARIYADGDLGTRETRAQKYR